MEESKRLAPGRSCTACRRRKIRCNRQKPCSYCIKVGSECVYPTKGQEDMKLPMDDFSARLKRIELSLQRIEANTTDSGASHILGKESGPGGARTVPLLPRDADGSKSGNSRLLFEKGNARYVIGGFWNDIDGDEDTVERSNTPSGEFGSTSTAAVQNDNGILFNRIIASVDASQLHPTESHIFAGWQIFIESVDPVLKLLHIPTTQRQLVVACRHLSKIPPAFESLMFSIYYATIASMQSSVSPQTLEAEERQKCLSRYRLGLEQSLTKADLMCKPSVTTLQALTLYLTCARGFVEKGYIWAMIGLLVRLAMKLGLHRDPKLLNLSPFMSEMRRRLWWQISTLDVRTAEDNDTEPLICDHVYDTNFPANINDADINVRMNQPPAERPKYTEMTFSLVRFEISQAARKLVFLPRLSTSNGQKYLSAQEKMGAIDGLMTKIDRKYLVLCDDEIPICFLTRTAAQLVLAKMKLITYHLSQHNLVGFSQDHLCQLVRDAVDILQYAHMLRSNNKYSRWVWLFQKYIEWDAAAFLLHNMKVIAPMEISNQAWIVIDQFFEDWSTTDTKSDLRWKSLQNLRANLRDAQRTGQLRADETEPVVSMMASSTQDGIDLFDRRNVDHHALRAQYSSSTTGNGQLSSQNNSVDQHRQLEDPESWFTDDIDSWGFDSVSYSIYDDLNWETGFSHESLNPLI